MNAVILSAGFGTRLKPLTDVVPKPLVKILNIKLIEYTLYLLKQNRIRDAYVNIHHLADKFVHIKVPRGMAVKFVREPEIRGTLGGILNFEKDLRGEDFFVINGDNFLHVNLKKMLELHVKRKRIATLLLKPNTGKYSSVYTDHMGNILSFFTPKQPLLKEYMFAGVQILSKDFFNYVHTRTNPSCLVKDYYLKLLEDNEILNSYVLEESDMWYECGNIDQYLNINLELFKKLQNHELQFSYESYIRDSLFRRAKKISEGISGIWQGKNVDIASSVLINPPVFISNGVIIEAGSIVGPNVIIYDNAKIEAQSELRDCLVLDKVVVPKSSHIKNTVCF